MSRARWNGVRALGRLKTGQLNNTEKAYESLLLARQRAGEIAWYKFEGIKLRLANKTFYTPDFAVMLTSGQMEIHEVKGFMMDDANAKIKIAADLYPFDFYLIYARPKRQGGGWDINRV